VAEVAGRPPAAFATGFSFGGMMSNAIGCEMGDVVRAIAPLSGSLWSRCGASTNRVAAIFDHAMDDNTAPYSAGEDACTSVETSRRWPCISDNEGVMQ
jgi:poly(3-hydroxybutyrate) depolymerase